MTRRQVHFNVLLFLVAASAITAAVGSPVLEPEGAAEVATTDVSKAKVRDVRQAG